MKFTKVFFKLAKSKKPLVIQQGGTSSSKTYSEIQKEIIIALGWQKKRLAKVTSIVAESLPHLKRGAIRDFLHIMKEEGLYSDANWNKSEYTYKFGDSVIEFFSADNDSKMRGGRRNRLFINECNNVTYESFQQLDVRTKEQTTLDYNPVSEFWVHTEVMTHLEHNYIQSTYKDNEYLEDKIVRSIEARKHQENWWKVYGLGEVGSLEGVIFNNWDIVKEIPSNAKLIGYGLDFGYTNDPTSLIEIRMMDNELYLNEVIYQTGLMNNQIAKLIKEKNVPSNAEIYADSAEPKSIDEIKTHGIWIRGADKGQDSIRYGIDILQQYKLHVTENSLNLIKELRNYQWAVDKEGKPTNKPSDIFNHAIDATRYCCSMALTLNSPIDIKKYPNKKEQLKDFSNYAI